MPRWGLTEHQIELKPWGIPEEWLEPDKIITDPVHGDIYLTKLEAAFLDSPPIQRLRRVRQLGTASLVYPGATHTRFSHALGTLRAAQDLLDAADGSRSEQRNTLFAEWKAREVFDEEFGRATVLARLGALLHDLCHVPFGHTIEDELLVLQPHDENKARFDTLWKQIPEELRALVSGRGLLTQLRPLILSKRPGGTSYDPAKTRYPFVSDVVGNTICADLIDYLQRDHLYTGLPLALGDRFKAGFYVTSSRRGQYASRLVIRITKDGKERTDVITELLKYLRYRYELSERVLYHHAKSAADAMVGKMLEMWTDVLWVETSRAKYAPVVAAAYDPVPENEQIDRLKEALGEVQAVEGSGTGRDHVKHVVTEILEREFVARGDDGLLEYLRDWGGASQDDDRRAAVGSLARAVLERRLFKFLGSAATALDRSNARQIVSQFGTPDVRRRLELRAVEHAEMHSKRWQVVVWMPPPKMRLKVAEVLVDSEGSIVPLDAKRAANDIYLAHEQLWSVQVFADRSVVDDRSRSHAVLASLGSQMAISMRTWDGDLIEDPVERELQQIIQENNLSEGEARRLVQAVREHYLRQVEIEAMGGVARTAIRAQIMDLAKRRRIRLNNKGAD